MKAVDYLYKIGDKGCRSVRRILKSHPSSAPYLSGDSFRAEADHVLDLDSDIDPRAIRRGDLVFVATHELPRFEAELLPLVRERFVLVTHNSDWNVDSARARLAEDERIAGWFAQNVVFRHPKITHLPIGLENRWRHNNGIVGDYRRLRRGKSAKRPRILFGFSVGTNAAEREPALRALRAAPAADELEWTNSRDYRRRLNGYRFVASPPGNGIDCHRTWEALYLGVVPIVKRAPLYDGFPGLPILAVSDWSATEGWTEDRLGAMYDSLAKDPEDIPCLWMDHWRRAFDDARRRA